MVESTEWSRGSRGRADEIETREFNAASSAKEVTQVVVINREEWISFGIAIGCW